MRGEPNRLDGWINHAEKPTGIAYIAQVGILTHDEGSVVDVRLVVGAGIGSFTGKAVEIVVPRHPKTGRISAGHLETEPKRPVCASAIVERNLERLGKASISLAFEAIENGREQRYSFGNSIDR